MSYHVAWCVMIEAVSMWATPEFESDPSQIVSLTGLRTCIADPGASVRMYLEGKLPTISARECRDPLSRDLFPPTR